MTTLKKLIASAAVATVLSLAGTLAASAADITMKPMQGLSFEVGSKHAVSYYLRDNGACKLVLTLAEAPNWDEGASLVATRFEAAIDGGSARRFDVGESKQLEFACGARADKMSVRWLEQVASSPPRK
jgi:hypothetical protein